MTGDAIFNRSQLQTVNNISSGNSTTSTSQAFQDGYINLTYAPLLQQSIGQDFNQQVINY